MLLNQPTMETAQPFKRSIGIITSTEHDRKGGEFTSAILHLSGS